MVADETLLMSSELSSWGVLVAYVCELRNTLLSRLQSFDWAS